MTSQVGKISEALKPETHSEQDIKKMIQREVKTAMSSTTTAINELKHLVESLLKKYREGE